MIVRSLDETTTIGHPATSMVILGRDVDPVVVGLMDTGLKGFRTQRGPEPPEAHQPVFTLLSGPSRPAKKVA